MAWTAPRTWVTGELVTSTMLNTHIRDNLNAINSIPGALIYKNGSQALPGSQSAVWVTITSFTVGHDTDSLTSTADRLTFNTAGYYLVGGSIEYDAASATGNARSARIFVSGSLAASECLAQVANANKNGSAVVPSRLYNFVVGDYIQLQGQHDATGALNAIAGQEKTTLWARRLAG